jgi:uncharacterized protein YabE (DUF348 family)
VRTFSATVQDLLQEQGLSVGPHDAVIPATAAPVADGATVEIRRGRLVTLMIDGAPHEVWTTASTVEELATALGSRYEAALTTASRSQRIPLAGLTLDVRMPKLVTIVHDGVATDVVTTAPSLAAVLVQAGVEVSDADLLSADLSLAPVDGLRLTVVRVTTDRVTSRSRIVFDTRTRPEPSLYRGVTRVVTPGRAGVRATTYLLTLHDGAVVAKKRISAHTLRKPVTRVVIVGTRVRPTTSTKGTRTAWAVDGLNWSALARCESSGNPRAIGGGGIYFGLYQFNLSTWHGVGGVGNPIDASPAEQTYRAKLLYRDRGAQPWPVCGPQLFT